MSNFKLGPKQRKWLRELPKYEKTQNELYRPGKGFCCLGVAAELFSPVPWEIDYDGDAFYRASCGDRLFGRLAEEDYQALRLRSGSGDFSEPIDGLSCLAEVNDAHPDLTHADMAEFINKHADKIFVEAK